MIALRLSAFAVKGAVMSKFVGVARWRTSLISALLLSASGMAWSDANPDFQPDNSKGVDQTLDYTALLKFGPWDDRNYQVRKQDLSILPADDRFLPGVPAFFKILKRKEMIAQGYPLQDDLYPREANKEFQYRFGGLIQDGVHFLTERGKHHYQGPTNPEPASSGLLATDPVRKAAPVLGQGPFDGTLSNNETTIEYHPTDPNIVIAGSNGSGGQRMSFSTDGGASWGNSGALNGTCCDPAIDFTADGSIAFAATLGQSASGCGFSLCSSVYWSFNGGQNWVGPTHTSTASSDKEFIHVDKTPGSPFQNRVYLTWHQGNVMQFTRSTALPVGGANPSPMTFAPATAFSTDERGIGSDIATDRQGRVYYVYPSVTSGSAELYLLRSDDGGASFVDLNGATAGLGKMIYDLHGRFDFAIPAMESRRVFIYAAVDVDLSGGPRDGRVYVTFTDENAAAGSPGNGSGSAANSHGWIQVVYSDDQGVTWSVATTPHSTADQTTVDRFQPWMDVDGIGNVHIGWQDTRNSGAGVRNKADWYYAVSSDGGATWIEETRVSSVVSENISNGQEWGDYNGLAVSPDNSTIAMTWTDNRIVTPPSTVSQRSFAGRVQNIAAGPTYLLSSAATSFDLCAGAPVPPVDITLSALSGFTGNVTMSTPGLNVAVFPTSSFNPNPVVPTAGGATTQLNLTTAPAAPAGTYTVTMEGTNGGGTPIVRADSFVVNLVSGTAAVATLALPANGAIGVPTAPSLTWTASVGAQSYLVEVASDAAFTTIIASGTVSGTSFAPTGLAPSTEYFWRVRAQNGCGNSDYSEVRDFTTANEICFTGSQAITDNLPAGVTNTLSGFAGNISDLNVSVKINHTWVGDLIVSLRNDPTGGPAGTPVVLIDRPGRTGTTGLGCSANDIDVILDDAGTGPAETACSATPPAIGGTLTPNNPLSAFNNTDFAGNWVLTVSDNVSVDTGALVEWCLLPDIAVANPDLLLQDGFED
jgi:hypothetical protein